MRRYDNEFQTGELRWLEYAGGTVALQQEWKCWDAADPLNPVLLWKDVPKVDLDLVEIHHVIENAGL